MRYFELLAAGFAAQPPASTEAVPEPRGRQKQSAAKNLLDDLLRRADQVLAFLDDLSIPFTNHQAERDLRMVKAQQKIAETFRSEVGATAFCHIRSYLSTMRKQGHMMLAALAAVFTDTPLPIAWVPGLLPRVSALCPKMPGIVGGRAGGTNSLAGPPAYRRIRRRST